MTEITRRNSQTTEHDTLIIPFDNKINFSCQTYKRAAEEVSTVLKSGLFKGDYQEVYSLSTIFEGNLLNIVLLGLGEKENLENRDIFLSFSKAFSICKGLKSNNVKVLLDNASNILNKYEIIEKICESALLANYDFKNYKTITANNSIKEIEFETTYENFEEALKEAEICGNCTNLARNLINQPSAFMTPAQLAKEAENAKKYPHISVSVLDKKKIEELDMNAFLAVGKGSPNEPKLIVIKYTNGTDNKVISLIGKGITYDSGGYCLKSPDSLPTMHGDMAGAAAVIGAMLAIAQMELKINVTGIIAACENKISGDAYVPGDIVKSMSGKFIEINNSDAEGRLTLADAITYAIKIEKTDVVIDIATLTGAVITALGNRTAGLVTNNDKLADITLKASKIACEKVWRLPADKELRHALDSNVADIRNSSHDRNDVGGNTILGGLFLQEFVNNKPWAHIDIASTGWTSEDLPYCRKGGVGFGTSLLYNIVKLMSADEI
ncbi:leucyl aminopeptidase [Tepidanaerobacter syntrophicus]|uniref:leucyl aminopeptidase n=1 Tax=Tepidanaerobacter syntrophicus TaxID=224999 RepID=UPI001BD27DBD|nr:leucyl aminopeptidase [Tepidanaerobacter syntrophicus]